MEAREVLHAVLGECLEEQQQRLFGGGLGEEPAVGRGGELGAWIRGGRAENCSHFMPGQRQRCISIVREA